MTANLHASAGLRALTAESHGGAHFLTNWKSLLFLLIIPWLAFGSMVVLQGSIPVSKSDLTVVDVQLGDVPIQEKREAVVRITNQRPWPVFMDQPNSGCGCMTVNKQPFWIGPYGSIEIPFTLTMPSQPGPVARQIRFRSRSSEMEHWTATVEANVIANVWAEPSSLVMTCGRAKSIATAEVQVRCQPGRSIQSVVSDSQFCKVEMGRPLSNGVICNVSVDLSERPEGNGLITATDDEGHQQTIPYRWAKLNGLSFVPRVTPIPEESQGNPRHIRSLLVSEKGTRSILIRTLVPWVELVPSAQEGSSQIVQLRIKEGQMPDHFQGELARAEAEAEDGTRMSAVLRAESRSSLHDQ